MPAACRGREPPTGSRLAPSTAFWYASFTAVFVRRQNVVNQHLNYGGRSQGVYFRFRPGRPVGHPPASGRLRDPAPATQQPGIMEGRSSPLSCCGPYVVKGVDGDEYAGAGRHREPGPVEAGCARPPNIPPEPRCRKAVGRVGTAGVASVTSAAACGRRRWPAKCRKSGRDSGPVKRGGTAGAALSSLLGRGRFRCPPWPAAGAMRGEHDERRGASR